jgi:hypothetical protein
MELDISNVTLYRMSLPDHDCPWGLKAIALLNERQISFEEHLLRVVLLSLLKMNTRFLQHLRFLRGNVELVVTEN